ncbi:MAG: hypothetical protein ACON42_05740 [Flavobacteriaceae bacterium]
MKNNLFNFGGTLLLSAALSVFLPWWSIMLAAFVMAVLVPVKKTAVFIVPFLAVGLYWGIYALVLSSANEFILARKIAVLFPLNGNPYLLLLATASIGGFAAGSSAVLGKQLSAFILNRNTD